MIYFISFFLHGERKYVTQKWIIDDYYFLRIVSTGGKTLNIEIRNTSQKGELRAMTLCPFFLVLFIQNTYLLFIVEWRSHMYYLEH